MVATVNELIAPGQNGRKFADHTIKFFKEHVCVLVWMAIKFLFVVKLTTSPHWLR